MTSKKIFDIKNSSTTKKQKAEKDFTQTYRIAIVEWYTELSWMIYYYSIRLGIEQSSELAIHRTD